MTDLDLPALIGSVARDEDTAYVLSRDRRLLRTNAGWERFARENGGEALLEKYRPGASIDDALPAPLRAFYVEAFERALATDTRWEHDYECSSPEEERRFRMIVYPVMGHYLVVVHSLRVTTPHARDAPSSEATYVEGGTITMCSHCRRVRHPKRTGRWDWVPSLLEKMPPNVSHGLCEPCFHFYYPP